MFVSFYLINNKMLLIFGLIGG